MFGNVSEKYYITHLSGLPKILHQIVLLIRSIMIVGVDQAHVPVCIHQLLKSRLLH
ncbi:hypothetical protein D3C81_2158480 [compost metagenome]